MLLGTISATLWPSRATRACAIAACRPPAPGTRDVVAHVAPEPSAGGLWASSVQRGLLAVARCARSARSGSRPHYDLTDPTMRDRLLSGTQTGGATAGSAQLPPLAPCACPTRSRHRHPRRPVRHATCISARRAARAGHFACLRTNRRTFFDIGVLGTSWRNFVFKSLASHGSRARSAAACHRLGRCGYMWCVLCRCC